MDGIIGKKIGMTQVYDGKGVQVPVTVIEAGPCTVVQRKTAAKEGYDAAQIGFADQKESRLTKGVAGHFKKNSVVGKRVLREILVAKDDESKSGDAVTVAIFEGVSYVDVVGTSKGQGFQGVMKRHDMAGQPAAHGHTTHRRVGSIGMRTWPARVMKGKRMPGHDGHERVTTQNLRVIQVRPEDNALLVEGSVPGPNGGLVLVHKALKKVSKK